jgi:hypothetical protein
VGAALYRCDNWFVFSELALQFAEKLIEDGKGGPQALKRRLFSTI